jgi:hypothetical protein
VDPAVFAFLYYLTILIACLIMYMLFVEFPTKNKTAKENNGATLTKPKPTTNGSQKSSLLMNLARGLFITGLFFLARYVIFHTNQSNQNSAGSRTYGARSNRDEVYWRVQEERMRGVSVYNNVPTWYNPHPPEPNYP